MVENSSTYWKGGEGKRRDALLKKLWGEGTSATAIAAQLGGLEHYKDKGRSAVLGRIYRRKYVRKPGVAARIAQEEKERKQNQVKPHPRPPTKKRKGKRDDVDGAYVRDPVTEFKTRLGKPIPPPLAVHINPNFRSGFERLEEEAANRVEQLINGTWKPKGTERPLLRLPLFKQREIRAKASRFQAFMQE